MAKKTLNTCLKGSCDECEIKSKITCNFRFMHFIRFYSLSAPAYILGGWSMYSSFSMFFYLWFIAIGLFFLFAGTRVLCTHCPHYNTPARYLKCHANYGIPKLWKPKPFPMNRCEKAILIAGHVLIWTYPMIFMVYAQSWILFILYCFFVIFFFIMHRWFNCKKCIHFSCPFNAVNELIKNEFLNNNQAIKQFF
ncbi:MAG: hypothetical protein U0W24_10015 [Bacteroidales bacterium]